MRAWIGMVTVSAISLAADLYALAAEWPLAVILVLVVVGLAAVALSFPVPVERPATAFIRGDASHSSFVDIVTDADVFVDGDAREALFFRVAHRTRGRWR